MINHILLKISAKDMVTFEENTSCLADVYCAQVGLLPLRSLGRICPYGTITIIAIVGN